MGRRAPALRALLRRRATLLARLRAFMAARGIVETDTPLLRRWPAPDAHVRPVPAGAGGWLQSSPEAAMKGLLAAGSGPIYQLGHVFREGEHGPLHAPEFTLLEWYRPGFDAPMLMREIGVLLVELGLGQPVRLEYRRAFYEGCALDPHTAPLSVLQECAGSLGLADAPADRATLLDFIMATRVLPGLGHAAPVFLVDFPACQAGLARVDDGIPPVARRFELLIRGMEIANGCHELIDPDALRARLGELGAAMATSGRHGRSIDQELCAAADAGIPACAGVALGVERLYMALYDVPHIHAALCRPSFPGTASGGRRVAVMHASGCSPRPAGAIETVIVN